MAKVKEMTSIQHAKYRVEMTRRELHRLLAKVELGTDIGYELSRILEDAISRVEVLAEIESEEE